MENTQLAPMVQLTPFEQTKENLVLLALDYKNLVVTRENLKEANEARLVLYRKRIEIQNVAKSNRKTIKEFLKNNNDALEIELIETIEPTEIALEDKIRVIKYEIAEEERIETARIADIKEQIECIDRLSVFVVSIDDEKALADYMVVEFKYDFQEFANEANESIEKLRKVAAERLKMVVFNRQEKEKETLAVEVKMQSFDEPIKDDSIDKASHALTKGFVMPNKTVQIGSNIETKSDKDLLEDFANRLVLLPNPHVVSDKAKKHVDYIQSMLSKLSEQTIKVAGGL
jgi:hypothetical protein